MLEEHEEMVRDARNKELEREQESNKANELELAARRDSSHWIEKLQNKVCLGFRVSVELGLALTGSERKIAVHGG